MIKIKLECWWTDSLSLNTRLLKQFVDSKDLDQYSFVTNNPDYTIVFGRTDWDKIETTKENTFYFSQEPLWSPNQPKDKIHEYCSKILVSDKTEYPNREEYIETLLPMFYAGHGETDSREQWDWSKNLKNKHYNKTKPVSVIVRKDCNNHYGHLSRPETSQSIHEVRTKLGLALSVFKNIDIYGINWTSNGDNIKGHAWNKHVGLDDYMFSVACENTIQKNYISEKFWDLILTNTVPIYLGCNNINELIPSDCYINLANSTLDKMVETILAVANNPEQYYNKYIQQIQNLKTNFFVSSKYNVWEKIKELINQ